VDRLAHRRNAPEDLVPKSHYGQLYYLFSLKLPRHDSIPREKRSTKLLLALVLEAPTVVEDKYGYQTVWYDRELSSGEVVDAATIQCVVGRVYDTLNKRWWIIDRSSALAYPEYV
jgi:hypothetical protein